MTERQIIIGQKILEALNQMDGGQLAETVLHAQVNLLIKPNATLGEFEDALGECDRMGWVMGVPNKFNKNEKRWTITNEGESARLEMQRQ